MEHGTPTHIQDQVRDPGLTGRLKRTGLLVGFLGLALAVVLGVLQGDELRRFFHAYLVGYAFVLSIALGGLFFVAIQYLTNSHWSVTVRRLAEYTAGALPFAALLGLPLLYPLFTPVGAEHGGLLWPWLHPQGVSAPVVEGKAAWLNPGFFCLRLVLYGVVWSLLGRFFLRNSLAQDTADDYRPSERARRWSAIAVILYALTSTFASFDLLMSLDPAWFSTMYGVYYFSGSVVAIFAWLILASLMVQRSGNLRSAITVEHYHDLGKFLFAFIFFWGYIAISQYLLIWYGNMPEETSWFLRRQTDAWMPISWLLVFGHFVIPFAGVMSRHTKRRVAILGFWAFYMLVMHWFDVAWLVMPAYDSQHLPLGLLEVSASLGLCGFYVAAVARLAGDRPLAPVNDPLLPESLAFENV